ncbi:MAG: hypothetical protein HYZ39_16380 [Mycolicibacterium cosmeticum]|nr:hypothetical protein [Mycolicibacterium cosmeticum]
MPRYTNPAGVVVDIPAELADRLHGYTPADDGTDATVAAAGTGSDGSDGSDGASDPNTSAYTPEQWADWLEAEEDYHTMVETWLEAEEAARKTAEPASRTGRK